jgi:PAS domain S-box-containing protein
MMDRLQAAVPRHADSSGPRNFAGGRRIGFRRALWITGSLVIAAMAILQTYDIMRRLAIVIETTEQSYASLVRTLAEQTADTMEVVDVVLRDTAANHRVATDIARGSELHQRLRDRIIALPRIRDLVVLDANGDPVASAAGLPPKRISQADRPYFSAHRDLASIGLYISEPFRQGGTGGPTVALSRRMADADGRFLGVAAAFLDLGYFEGFYAAIALEPGSNVNLMRRDGSLLVRYPASGAATGLFKEQNLYRGLLAGSHAAAALPAPLDGGDRIYAAQMVAGYPFAVGASVPKTVVFKPWNEQVMHSTLRTSLLCLSVALLMWLVLRELRRRERAEEGLRVQTALLDELVESAPEAIVMLDLQERVTRVNREFTRMFGYSDVEAKGRTLDDLIVPEDLKTEGQRLARAVANGQHTSMETERIRKNGERLPVSELGAPILTDRKSVV